MEQEAYQGWLEKEQEFWDHFNEDALKYGIPHWLDLRNATRLNRPVWSPFDDPKIEAILRGEVKRKFLQKATKQNGRALDLGCGMGWLSLELARAGISCDAYDVSKKSIQIAREYAAKVRPKAEIRYDVANLNTLTLPEDSYDLVVVWDVVHHIVEPERLFREVRKTMKRSGLFLLFDHIGLEEKNLRFYRIFHLFVPASFSMYSRKIRHILGFSSPVPAPTSSSIPDAPFEHHSERKILPALLEVFPGVQYTTHLSFAMHLAHHHQLPSLFSYFLLRQLKKLDDYLIRRGYLGGEYLFAEWRKL